MKADIITSRVEALRTWMKSHGLCAYIFPSTDPHSSEYVPDHWKAREWISGFNGSAGTAVVSLTRAALWTDSRYWLAAEEQTKGTPFEVVRCERNVATPEELAEWIVKEPAEDGSLGTPVAGVGMDAFTNTINSVLAMQRVLQTVPPFELNTDVEPCADLWDSRPSLPDFPVEIQPIEYAGRLVADKLDDIRAALRKDRCGALIVSQLDEIAWTLNLRGKDVHCTPVFVAYLLIHLNGAALYVDSRKLPPEVRAHLAENKVDVCPYETIFKDIARRKAGQQDLGAVTFHVDCSVANFAFLAPLEAADSKDGDRVCHWRNLPSPIPALRAAKNPTEIAGFRSAMLKDGVAMVKFLRWMDEAFPWDGTDEPDGNCATTPPAAISELSADHKLTALRAQQPLYRDNSFDTIAGYGSHGAIVHYEASPETDIPLQPRGMLLLDSGAQYQDGTTDITRTIPLGPLTSEERRDYTLVLKGHIRLATAVFPEGTTGTQLDVLARYAMWQDHKNYGHGTGHGVGSYLSVHEGPHQFRMNHVAAPLRAGMTVTIEPGIYIPGCHGVRIENTMLIESDIPQTAPPSSCPSDICGAGHTLRAPATSGWLKLTPLTLCPIDTRPIVLDMLLPDETAYLNNYHARVREALLPLLDDEPDRAWLLKATEEIGTRNRE